LKLHYAHKPERGVKGKLKVDHLEEEHDSESSSEWLEGRKDRDTEHRSGISAHSKWQERDPV